MDEFFSLRLKIKVYGKNKMKIIVDFVLVLI